MKKGLLLAGLLLSTTSAFAQEYSNCREFWRDYPEKMKEVSVLAIPSGGATCSLEASISDDRQAFTVFYNDFYIQGNGRSVAASCSFNVKICLPSGFSISVNEFTNMGQYNMATNGVKMVNRTRYFVQGFPSGGLMYETEMTRSGGKCYQKWVNKRTRQTGYEQIPCNDFYESIDKFKTVASVWSVCGTARDLTVANQLAISGTVRGTTQDYFGLDLTDGSITTERYHPYYRFSYQLRKCK